jgi:hypothetical protein
MIPISDITIEAAGPVSFINGGDVYNGGVDGRLTRKKAWMRNSNAVVVSTDRIRNHLKPPDVGSETVSVIDMSLQ